MFICRANEQSRDGKSARRDVKSCPIKRTADDVMYHCLLSLVPLCVHRRELKLVGEDQQENKQQQQQQQQVGSQPAASGGKAGKKKRKKKEMAEW